MNRNWDAVMTYINLGLIIIWILTGKIEYAVLLGAIIYWGRGGAV